MSLPRILATNRRERGGREIDLATLALHAAAWLLTLFASLRRHREPKKVQERPTRASDVQTDAYADHLYAELRRIGR